MTLTQQDLDRLYVRAEMYQVIIDEINRVGEDYDGELDYFVEELNVTNSLITEILVKDNDDEIPF